MLRRPEKYFPLRVRVCQACWLVQAEAYSRAAELFNEEYAYFSSYSSAWLAHAEAFSRDAIREHGLGPTSHVVEVAANDGYLLQYFRSAGVPCLGVEPTASTAAAARQRGIEVVQDFLTVQLARDLVAEGRSADLLVANNVLAHVPDLVDFVEACRILLKTEGVASFEFPHLMNLVEHNQFDTVYHEHFYYFSLQTVIETFAKCGLKVHDVKELGTHGGSFRVWASHASSHGRPIARTVESVVAQEQRHNLRSLAYYSEMQRRAENVKHDLLEYLVNARRGGVRVAGYGAAAKGNTLLNFAGVRPDLLPFVADKSPHKQGKFLPGSRIPVVHPSQLLKHQPLEIIVFPWNLREEITQDLRRLGLRDTKLVCFVPERRLSAV